MGYRTCGKWVIKGPADTVPVHGSLPSPTRWLCLENDMTTLDPKEQYVRIESWGSLLLPLKHVALLEKAALVDSEYRDGRSVVKLKKEGNISFVMVPKQDIAAAIAAHRLES